MTRDQSIFEHIVDKNIRWKQHLGLGPTNLYEMYGHAIP